MKKLIFLFLFPFYLFSSSVNDISCCGEGQSALSFLSTTTFYSSRMNITDARLYISPDVLFDGSHSWVCGLRGEWIDRQALSYNAGTQWSFSVKTDTYDCPPLIPTCENNETLVNGECQPLLPSSCPFTPFEIDEQSTNVTECQSKVDGITYDIANWLTSDSTLDTCCLHPAPPKYDCSVLGAGWFDNLETVEADCLNVADDTTNISWQTGSDITGTCCEKNLNDNPSNPVDDNNTDNNQTNPVPDNGDNNDDNPPSADSTPASDPTDDILKSIQSDLGTQHSEAMTRADETNSILGDIKSDIGTASDKNHEDLENINSAVGASSNRNHKDLEGIDDKLKGIEDNSKGLLDYFDDMKDKAKDSGYDGVEDKLNANLEDANALQSTITGSLSELTGYITGAKPLFVATGDCNFNYNIFGRALTIDFSIIDRLRPYIDILYALLLAFINFKMYSRIFMFLVFLGI